PVINFDTCVKCTLCWIQCPDSCFDVMPDGTYDANMEACCGCGVCEAVCPVEHCVTMVNESVFDDNASQWEMWRKDKQKYQAWMADRVADQRPPVRSHAFRSGGMDKKELEKKSEEGAAKIPAATRGKNAQHKTNWGECGSQDPAGWARPPETSQ